jgi:hypothetical protein
VRAQGVDSDGEGRTTWSDEIDLPSALNLVRATDFQMTSLFLGSYRLKTKLIEAGMSMMLCRGPRRTWNEPVSWRSATRNVQASRALRRRTR